MEGYRFRFLGEAHGGTNRRQPATIETVVVVSTDTKASKIE
jgi:hypothetical protein